MPLPLQGYTLADDLGSVTGLPAFCDGCVALALSGPRVLYPRVLGSLSPLRCSPYPRIAAYSFHYLEPTDCISDRFSRCAAVAALPTSLAYEHAQCYPRPCSSLAAGMRWASPFEYQRGVSHLPRRRSLLGFNALQRGHMAGVRPRLWPYLDAVFSYAIDSEDLCVDPPACALGSMT